MTYDLNGNLLSRVSGTTTTTYEWDAANRLIAIEVEGETRSEFLYDGLSRRVGITETVWDSGTSSFIPQNSSFFLWDGLTIAEQRSGINGATVEKRFFPQGVEILTGAASGIYTYRTDHLGSIREVIDDQGNLTARFDYSPWGELETVSGNFDLQFGFTGHFIHLPTELYLAPFRAYDAGLGRWLSRDPLGFAAKGTNLYFYSGNNPIDRVDPLGLDFILLLNSSSVYGAGHSAAITGPVKCKWRYDSFGPDGKKKKHIHGQYFFDSEEEALNFARDNGYTHYARWRQSDDLAAQERADEWHSGKGKQYTRHKPYGVGQNNCQRMVNDMADAAGIIDFVPYGHPRLSFSQNRNSADEHGEL